MNPPMLEANALAIGYRRRTILENLQLSLHPGELVCLLGGNGIGKSTLLRTLAALMPPLAGSIKLHQSSITDYSPTELARRRSFIAHIPPSADQLTAREMVALGRFPYTGWTGQLRPVDNRSIDDALVATACEALAQRSMGELSDGERQRVMIARALAQDAPVMLLDEPTSHLDIPRRVEVVRLLARLARTQGRAILMSTHELDLAIEAADRLWLMDIHGLKVGIPEDLVLSGDIENVLGGPGIRFDIDSGRFQWTEPGLKSIALHGEPRLACWTAHALRRLGYEAQADSSSDGRQIRVESNRWILQRGEEHSIHPSLESLIAELRKER